MNKQSFVSRAVQAAVVAVCLLFSTSAYAQWTAIDNTTFSTAVTSVTATTVSLASVTCTNCTFGRDTWLYADAELMIVTGAYVSGTTNIPVRRGGGNTRPAFHTTTAKVFVGPASRYQASDPPIGACLRTNVAWSPWINVANGYRWTCDNGNSVTSSQTWRAMVPWALAGGSDPTAKLRPSGPETLLAMLITKGREFFVW